MNGEARGGPRRFGVVLAGGIDHQPGRVEPVVAQNEIRGAVIGNREREVGMVTTVVGGDA